MSQGPQSRDGKSLARSIPLVQQTLSPAVGECTIEHRHAKTSPCDRFMLADTAFTDIAHELMLQPDRYARWRSLTSFMETIGLGVMNYAYVDPALHNDPEHQGRLAHTTLPQSFIDHFADRNYASTDAMARYLSAGGVRPVLFDVEAHTPDRDHASDVVSAGLKGGLFIPLPGATLDGRAAVAGLSVGSGASPETTHRTAREYGAGLVALTHLFHALSAGDHLAEMLGLANLTTRERDCLSWTAKGDRIGQIAHRLNIAEITVAKHLANARKKLGARNLPEAVARGLLLQQVVLA